MCVLLGAVSVLVQRQHQLGITRASQYAVLIQGVFADDVGEAGSCLIVGVYADDLADDAGQGLAGVAGYVIVYDVSQGTHTRCVNSLLLFFDRKCKDDEIQDAQNECDPIAGLDVFEHKPRNQKQADQDYSGNQLNNSSLTHVFSLMLLYRI